MEPRSKGRVLSQPVRDDRPRRSPPLHTSHGRATPAGLPASFVRVPAEPCPSCHWPGSPRLLPTLTKSPGSPRCAQQQLPAFHGEGAPGLPRPAMEEQGLRKEGFIKVGDPPAIFHWKWALTLAGIAASDKQRDAAEPPALDSICLGTYTGAWRNCLLPFLLAGRFFFFLYSCS